MSLQTILLLESFLAIFTDVGHHSGVYALMSLQIRRGIEAFEASRADVPLEIHSLFRQNNLKETKQK